MIDVRVIHECERVLRNLLNRAASLSRHTPKTAAGVDVMYTLRLPSGDTLNLCAVVRKGLRPAALPQLVERMRLRTGEELCERRILFADYVTVSLADQLRERGLWFVDESGNAYLEQPGVLLIFTVGQRPMREQATKGQYFSEPGAKVLYYLLHHGPQICATYRDIRQAVGVSLDKISKTFNELKDQRLLIPAGRGQYEILNPSKLLDQWSDAYAAKLRPRIFLGRFRSPFGKDFTKMFEEAGSRRVLKDVVVGGEYAGDRLTGYLRARALNLYVSVDRATTVRRVLRLAPSQEGNIELHEAFAQSFGKPRGRNQLAIAHPVLVYAELLVTDDPRCGETAVRLKEKHLPWIP
ncbi:hypothetical protein KAX17_07465 [Candidatus Bipolaricaulota bacterium]|nr:hypothetical protein [Candidatus Bipolaricaulota bacterium]